MEKKQTPHLTVCHVKPQFVLNGVWTVKWLSSMVILALICICQEVSVALLGGLPAQGSQHYQLQGVICILNGVIDSFCLIFM